MTSYVVVQRSNHLPVKHFMTIEAAGNYIVREVKYAEWTVLAQEGNRITAGTPYRALLPHERETLERTLWPTL